MTPSHESHHSHRTTQTLKSPIANGNNVAHDLIAKCVRLCSAVVTLDFNQQQSNDELHIVHRLIRSSNGEPPHHGGKAPGRHRWATDDRYNEQNGGANGPNGRSRNDHRMKWMPWISHPYYSSITKANITSTKPVNQPDTINKGIMAASTSLEILTFQEKTKKLQKEFDL